MPSKKTAPSDGKIMVRTPNVPGYEHPVDAAKYEAMKRVLLAVMPRTGPGLTQKEMFEAAREIAPEATFPGGTLSWWAKSVQLDLEARGVLVRDASAKPLRWKRRK